MCCTRLHAIGSTASGKQEQDIGRQLNDLAVGVFSDAKSGVVRMDLVRCPRSKVTPAHVALVGRSSTSALDMLLKSARRL
jgi:hypothetical protein